MTYGKESKDALVKLIGEKSTRIYVYEQDQFGRYVGDIYCDSVFIQVNQKLSCKKREAIQHLTCFSGFGYRSNPDQSDCVCLGPSGADAEEWSRMAFQEL